MKTQIIDEEAVPAETEEEKQAVKEAGYNVNIKVVDSDKNPVAGAQVTLYSEPKQSQTNQDGIATFTGVEPGEHRVEIAYQNFKGEEKIDLEGEVKEFNITVAVKPQNPFFSPAVMTVIVLLAAGLLYFIYRDRWAKAKS